MAKEIYSFVVNKKVKKEVTEEQGDTKITKTIEVDEPVKIVLKQPSRTDADQADEVYSLEYARCFREGMLTHALIQARYDDNGYITNQRNQLLLKSKEQLEIQNEFTLLKVESEQENAERLKELEVRWNILNEEIQRIQQNTESIFPYQ